MLRWTLQLTGAPKRSYHNASVVVGHKVYSFGGYCNQEAETHDMDQIEVHVFHTVSMRWRMLPTVTTGRGEGPSLRQGHTTILMEDIIYMWGGRTYTNTWCNVLYAFDVDAHRWSKPKVSGTVPEGRWSHSACVLEKVMYIYGGFSVPTGYYNDMYKLDATTWSLINTGGTPASWHSATIIGTKMFVFGDRGRYKDGNTLRVFDTKTYCWLSTQSAQLPEGRWCHSAFAYNGELYIFGGHMSQAFNDLWKFNPGTFSWRKIEPMGKDPYELKSMMCCCMVRDCIILFGGYRYASLPDAYLYKNYNRMSDQLYILDLSPSLKTVCKLAVVQYGVEQSGLPHNIRWELAAMTTNKDQV